MLSETSKRRRHRATVISIHITFTSWILEFLCNWLIILLLCIGIQNGTIKFLVLVLDTGCCFILIPASYICNTEKVKGYLNTIGWYISLIDKSSSNAIQPSLHQNIEMRAVPRPRLENQGEVRFFQAVPNHSKKLLRTKSQPLFKLGPKVEHRKRSLNLYSETIFDLSIYWFILILFINVKHYPNLHLTYYVVLNIINIIIFSKNSGCD